ncbi:MAG: SDR family NAD(P)-dependent oxidoreductase [Xanthomonadaceae bacterium]|nr:SDR family NAD(P)-dependent oxidoreductase [Xanthomonadaceae bacterium]MDE2177259.1 SDR family NAD(P)-dependent oxidoreductase [Xanthomonadaceae bacterium]MDE2245691.1 SDR family NAD(P)-dependent oxidoreductase [Xanthomonadaceae bacterium]
MIALPVARLPGGWEADADTLAGRVILVTGASGGLGQAVSLACAAAGASVVLLGRNVRALESVYDAIKAAGGAEPAIYPLNLEGASPRDCDGVATAIERDLGGLDGVVHAAARFDGLTPLDVLSAEEWLRVLQVNLTAPFLLMQALLPLLLARADSAAVFVLDDLERMRRAHWGAYGVAKAGLETLAAILHQEHDAGPLRVHALLPAPMRTALRKMAWFGEDTLRHPLPAVTAMAVVYLLSPAGMDARGALLDLRGAG